MATTHTPPEPSTRPRRTGLVALIVVGVVIALGAIALLVIGGLALFVAVPTSSEGEPPPPVEAPTPAVVLPDGESFAYITEVGDASLTVDPARLLSGEEARAAAEADGVIAPGEDVPNDFYIVNGDPGPTAVGVEPGTEVTVLIFDSSGAITEEDIPLGDLATAFTGDDPGVAIYGLVAGEFPVTLTIEDGTVVGIEQVYLP